MKKLMLRCDVAICGGGQTTNELAACGLPIIGVRLAKNQNPNIRGWQQSGVLMLAGSPSDPKLFLKINRILQTMTWRERKCIAQMGQKLLDGKGALRAVQGILKLGLYVQKTWKKQKCADPPA
jgi:spore coat polysaccharide biosynthesis predicted glycosyltransferase SpsG